MPKKSFTLPRGMRDIDHIETIQRKWLYDRISRVADRYGFQRVDPSPMERLETLEAKSGPAIKNEIYCFKDKAGRDLGLRFDLTVGMTRMVASRRDLPEPMKLYAISGMWRYDEPQFARYRYFHQWDMEIYGSDDSMADAETISASMDILEELGLKDHEMLINNRVIIDGFLQNYKLSDEERMRVLRIIDKSRKTSQEVIIDELNKLGIKGDSLTKLMEFTSISGTPEKTLDKLESYKRLDRQALEGIETVKELVDNLKAYGKLSKCHLDMSVVRGIDYYDGIVFEAYDKGGEDVGSILGGGRYDRLGRIYGKRNLPATGVAGGIERLMISLNRQNLFPRQELSPKIYVTILKEEVKNHSIALTQRIRAAGLSCDIELKNRPLKRQLEYANSLDIPYTVMLGPRELQQNLIRIRDMKTRKETLISMDNFDDWLKKISIQQS